MPVNFLEISNQITEKGGRVREYVAVHTNLIEQARHLLEQYSGDVELLQQRVEKAAALSSGLRCAAPTQEYLTSSIAALPVDYPYVILAADGSQINPSRHDQVEFGVINVGTIRMMPGQAIAPSENIKSELLALDDLVTSDGQPVGEDIVALRRDLFERSILSELAKNEQLPVVALTDGPLELFREPRGEGQAIKKEYSDLLQAYLGTLQELADQNSIVGGYVDKPKSDLVVRLLELLQLNNDELNQAGVKRSLRGITDAGLLMSILHPGERSAVFSIQSQTLNNFSGRLALHFFYLNVGYGNHPALARVEIPAWVAQDKTLLNLLHVVLVNQCKQMGTRPYPYVIHRAHEVAVVTFDEKQKLIDMIAAEWDRQGIWVDNISNKQAGKDAFGAKKRYKK